MDISYQNPNRAWQERFGTAFEQRMTDNGTMFTRKSSSYSDDRQQLFDLINEERKKNGITPLIKNNLLDISSNQKLLEQEKYSLRGHDSPSGKSTKDWFKMVNFKGNLQGENLAMGAINFSPEDNSAVIQSWLNSKAGHKELMLSPDFSEIGMARRGKFIVVHFGGNATSSKDVYKKYGAFMKK